ncbi:MAG: amidohydrolase family protein [Bacteroidales bacterium]|nr:amidohydrolase family protein [Bacteroidales bacterium]MBQ5528036.1 amidohydrolase family protein [Bacteroidales bacterium]MEE3463602.1 amidohydrolase family protein [Candidatus Cryptobacteroides sp.]
MKRIAAKYLFPLENSEPVLNGFVEVEDDGTVIRTGVCDDPSAEENFLDGVLAPGLVNTHCHIELSYMWKLFRKGTGMAGFIDQINALRDTSPLEEKLADIQHWMDHLWQQGVSAMGDISNCDDSFAIKAASPMYTRTFLEVFGTEPEDCASVIEGVLKLKEKADACGIDAAPTPHSCYTMSPELVTASSAEGLKSGFLSFHSEETDEEEEMLKSGSGRMWENRKAAGMSTPPVTGKSSLLYFIDRLEKAHPAPFDEHILLVHEVCMDQEGMDAVKKVMKNAYIALCPLSNLFIHNALPPVGLMRENGMKLTVGTDSLSSNDDLDMIAELRCLQENFADLKLGELLTWASRNGAEFLSVEDRYGRIAPGMKPGLVYIDNIGEGLRLTPQSRSYRVI